MMNDTPGLIAGDWGPFAMFGGGYRVSVPLYGSILQRVAGIDLYTFSAFLMVGVPVLTGLALGAFSWRTHRDPLLFLLVMLSSAALFMTTPYVGYLDNITVLYFLSLALAFFVPARTSWGARTALFLLGIAAAYTHPTTCVIFGFSLMAVFVLRVLTSRFHLGPPLKELGPSLMSLGFGMFFGLATWLLSPWGVAGSLADAALPPPYTKEVFLKRLEGWVDSLQPAIIVPLVLLAIGWTIWRARRDRTRSDEFGTISAMLLLPFLGIFGFVAATYPYYRFMNATMALFPLVGLGAYVAIKWLWKRDGLAKVAGVVASVLIVASLGYVWSNRARGVELREPGQPVDRPADADRARGGPRDRRERVAGPSDRVRRELRRHVSVLRLVEDLHERLARRPSRGRREALDDLLRQRRGLPGRPADRAHRRHLQQDVSRFPPRAHGAPAGVRGAADRVPRPAVQRGHGERGPARRRRPRGSSCSAPTSR